MCVGKIRPSEFVKFVCSNVSPYLEMFAIRDGASRTITLVYNLPFLLKCSCSFKQGLLSPIGFATGLIRKSSQ